MIPKNRAKRMDLLSDEHNKLRDWVLRRVDYAIEAKKLLEKDYLAALKHYCCWLNEEKHPWPSKSYKPIFFSTARNRLAKMMEAMFASPPILDYMPEHGSTRRQARAYSKTIDFHLRRTKPRKTIYNGLLGQMFGGTQMWATFWDYEQRLVQYWKRVPRADAGAYPGMQVNDGSWAWVLGRKITKDHPNIRAVPFHEALLDDRVDDVQRGEFAGTESWITAEEAEQRVACDGWDQRAVQRALKDDLQPGATNGMMGRIKHLAEIGMVTTAYQSGLEVDEETKQRGMIHVIELYRKVKGRVERLILLNRSWFAYVGWSPYGHGRYPYIVSRAYSLPGYLWGRSDYHVMRYLNRGIQTLINAMISEASTHAMPPLMIPENADILGFRWEPRALWRLRGMSPEQLKHAPYNGTAQQIAQYALQFLEQAVDGAFGTSEVSRGSAGIQAAAQKATAIEIAAQMSGVIEKLNIDNNAEEFMLRWGEDEADLVHQFQDYKVQVALEPGSEPITMYPEDLREIMVYPINTTSTVALRELRQKRLQDLWGASAQDPSLNRPELTKMVVESLLPHEVDRIVIGPEQQAAMMSQQLGGMPVQPGMQPGMQPGSPETTMYEPYGRENLAEQAAELREAMMAA